MSESNPAPVGEAGTPSPNLRAVYKLVWQTRQHETFAPFAADAIGLPDLSRRVFAILSSADELTHLRIEWKRWEKQS